MPRVKPTDIAWSTVPPEITYVKFEPDEIKSIERCCHSEAARGRAVWALISYFLTGIDREPTGEEAQSVYLALKPKLRRRRQGCIDGSKGGNPQLLKSKSKDKVQTKSEESTEKVRTKYKQSTTSNEELQGFLPADISEMYDD